MKLELLAYGAPVVVALVGVPLALGKIPPNGIYGFRTPKTRSSESIWYPANRFAGWALMAAGLAALCGNLIVLQMHPDWPMPLAIRWISGILVGTILLGSAACFVYLSKL